MEGYYLKDDLSKKEKLSFKEARKLYIKMQITNNEELKKKYRERIIIGTLYYVKDYVYEKSKLGLFETGSYDLDDIMSDLSIEWVKKIDEGSLIKVSTFSQILADQLIYKSCKNITNIEEIPNSRALARLIYDYIKLRKELGTFSEETIKENAMKTLSINDVELSIIEEIYDRFELDNNKLTLSDIENFIPFIIDIISSDSIYKENITEDKKSYDDIINNCINKDLKIKLNQALNSLGKKINFDLLEKDSLFISKIGFEKILVCYKYMKKSRKKIGFVRYPNYLNEYTKRKYFEIYDNILNQISIRQDIIDYLRNNFYNDITCDGDTLKYSKKGQNEWFDKLFEMLNELYKDLLFKDIKRELYRFCSMLRSEKLCPFFDDIEYFENKNKEEKKKRLKKEFLKNPSIKNFNEFFDIK